MPSDDPGTKSTASTPHLLGRPVLFEIAEVEAPESHVLFRWTVLFSGEGQRESVFELRDSADGADALRCGAGRCYELFENGSPCSTGRWHIGPETARNLIVSAVEARAFNNATQRTPSALLGLTKDLFTSLPASVTHLISSPGQQFLNLFRVT